MAETDVRALGERIKATRLRAGLSQEELGRAIGLERTPINKIESGARKVSALELADIADVLGVRMSTFFHDPVPAIVSHRSSEGLDTAESQIDALLAHLAGEVELVESLTAIRSGDLTPEDHEFFASLANASDAEPFAARARSLMEVSATDPITVLSEAVTAVGLLTFSRDIGKDTADAGTVLLRRGGVSLVNSHMKVGRRRLALAHELGHYLSADEYSVDWRVAGRANDVGPVESSLDRFARALLLPSTALIHRWRHDVERIGDRSAAIRLASEYRVDMATLATRLRELNLIDGAQSSEIRGWITKQADIVDLDLLVPLEEMQGTTVPREFARAVLRLVEGHRISRERALDLLQGTFEDDDLPTVHRRHPDEIWEFVS